MNVRRACLLAAFAAAFSLPDLVHAG